MWYIIRVVNNNPNNERNGSGMVERSKVEMEARLAEVYKECIDELDAIGVPYGNIVSVTVNYRAKRRWGLCKMVGESYKININADLLSVYASEKGLKETVIHEILHTCPNSMCHTGEWKKWATLVNDCYSYNIKRCNSEADKGMAEFYRKKREEGVKGKARTYKYVFTCADCGQKIKRMRASRFTEHYRAYRCGRCGGRFVKLEDYASAANRM